MHLLRLILIAVIASGLTAANAEQDIQKLLNKMNQTLEMGNYEGTFVFMHNGSVDTMRVIHGYFKNGVKEKLISLTGDAREVIQDQEVLTCIWPSKKLVVIEAAEVGHSLPSSLPKDINNIELHYKFTDVGQSRIAGYRCNQIRFDPLDEFRYGHQLCVNETHGMLLESKTFDSNGNNIESMMFTSFRMRESIPDEAFEPSIELNDYTWKTADVDIKGELQPDYAWQIQKMPPGFSMRSVNRRLISASKSPVQHMVITDGLVSVSVFIRKVDDPRNFYQGAHTKGVINAYARDLNQHQITVVGEVPEGTVKLIGSSIIYSKNN